MDCELIQAGISRRMDGDDLSPAAISLLDAHVAECVRCSAFIERSDRVRSAFRIHEAEAVPNLVEPIMAAIGAEVGGSDSPPAPARSPKRRRSGEAELIPLPWPAPQRPRRPAPARDGAPGRRYAATIAAALVAGLVLGSVLVGGPLPGADRTQRALGREVLERAARIRDLSATYRMIERNFAPDVPLRRFTMSVALSAPERFRLRIDDRSPYPKGFGFAPNDLSYIVNERSSYSAGPTACPAGLPTSCPRRRRIVTNRPPFSSSSPVLADLVLPVTTLGGLAAVTAAPGREMLGHETHVITLPYERAAPLFPHLQLFPALDLGDDAWRPFYPDDRVILWLDRETLFPLRSEIWAARGDRDRRDWELRWGMLRDQTKRPLLAVQATSFDQRPIADELFDVPTKGELVSERAHRIAMEVAADRVSFQPVHVADASGLDPYRAVATPIRDGTGTVLAYAKGVSWLKIAETRDWSEPALFGVDPDAQRVLVPGGAVGYFQPGTELLGRRLAVHTPDSDVVLETNLPREQLLEVASALALDGRPIPRHWGVRRAAGVVTRRVSLDTALQRVRFPVRLPRVEDLPPGYVVASAQLTRVHERSGLTVVYRQADTDLGGAPVHLHAEPAPAIATRQPGSRLTRVGGNEAFYDPVAQRLEWIDDGVYYAIESPGIEQHTLVQIASSLRRAEGTP